MFRELDLQTRSDLENYFQDKDYMVIAVPREELIRVYALRATRTVETARRVHALEGKSLETLGHSLLSALLLTSLVKHATPQKVLLKVQNDCGVVVAEADGKGRVRGFLEGQPQECWNSGTLSVVKELRLGTPYTSIVPVVGRDFQEALSFYFEQSEQTRSYLDMALSQKDGLAYATGYLVQVLSGVSEKSIALLEQNLKSLRLADQRPEDIAIHILMGMEPRLIGLKEVEYYCPCSEEIARSSLMLLQEEELEDILSEGPAEVVCKFCKRVYRFSREQLML
ncbi:MAG: Hsp33 family molecular chaperone HslO [Aquificaceae bacterium]|jgi:molecular chaperone Hsp33|uniref:Hsp33 family molecular chaperone HslO n=1 Tax=Hydrogenobacter sp. Uz 6-8 TaxID=3384828 RepID=UPI000F11CDF4|nr:MAG: Hsp33 family molecular chaperone HslO [Aquificota bacterium]